MASSWKGKGKVRGSEDVESSFETSGGHGTRSANFAAYQESSPPLVNEWTPWKWDHRGFFVSSKTDSSGKTEYTYSQPEEQKQDDIPRSTDSSAPPITSPSRGTIVQAAV